MAARSIARAVLVLALFAPRTARAAGEVEDPSCGTMSVPLEKSTVVYSLPHGFLRAGTDTVRSGTALWRAGEDYTLDLLRGELRLLHPPAAGETLSVAACWLLRPPPLTVQLVPYRIATAAPDTAAPETAHVVPLPYRPATARDPSRAPGEASLTLTGNKTLAIDFGSQQDAALRQSLDLAVSGTVAPGVELTGVLSDRNTPLTAGGSTQDLQSLDRVLLELKAPHADAALGDVPLAWNDGEFGRIERRLQGVRGGWNTGPFTAEAAAATQQGEFRRLETFGIEGQQGPYLLTDHDGNAGVPIVAGSEVVTVDGARLQRGESADYAIDYERGRITFTNRRPITSETRITVDYQVAASSYRRNLAAAGGRWEQGPLKLWTRYIQEEDDRGRPLDLALSAADRGRLALAGDSTALAIGSGVTASGGDYDTVRVAGALAYAFAGPDSGTFAVEFARIGAGRGDYAESTLVDGRTAFRYVGGGNGAFRIGHELPLPESHRLWTLGAGAARGGFSAAAEGAVTRLDLNTFSPFDDGDNVGGAGHGRLALETSTGGALAGSAGGSLDARVVERRFAPFTPLERPFAEESWGLPLGADLEHQRRADLGTWFRPRSGGELRIEWGRLATAGGFESVRRTASWTREGLLVTRGLLERAAGTQDGLRFPDGGRSHARGELGLNGSWLAPLLRAEWDERSSPSDTGRVRVRVREQAAELASGPAVPWRASASLSLRRDAQATRSGYADPTAARALRFGLESPAERRLTLALLYQHRDVDPHAAAPRTRSDLGSMRMHAENKGGASLALNMEVTSEGESRRERKLVFVGTGRGGYDALGNFVGAGDYDLVESVDTGFDKVARAATSAHLGVPFGRSERWRGSRLDFDFETDVRRRGELYYRDPVIAPRVVEGDASLARGSVLQRLSADLAPGSASSAVFVRLERRVTSDRSYVNFAQVLDDRSASARWRPHPSPAVGAELEVHARRQQADQALAAGAAFQRALEEGGGELQGIWTPGARLRAVAALEATWSRPEGAELLTRRLRVGPDLGLSIGARGRLETSFRRSFTSGPPLLDLLPTADPLGTLRWEGSTRLDWRVHETTTFGTSFTLHDRAGRRTQMTGRAELRAFF